MQRYLNLLKILAGYLVSRFSRKVYHWGNPVSISIEPTNRCNLHCPECPSGALVLTRKRGQMSIYTFKEIITDLRDFLFYLTLYFQGEPYLNKDFFEMVRFVKENDIFVTTSTNGHYLTPENIVNTIESGLDEIIISVDGTDQDTYETYRMGGNLQTVMKGINDLSKKRKEMLSVTPVIIVQFIVFRHNQDQIRQIRTLGKKWGADKVIIKTAQINDFEDGNELMPDLDKFCRYRKTTDEAGSVKWSIKNKLENRCWRMWSSAVFTWEGDVVPCCYDKDAEFRMGNINDEHFQSIWRNKKYELFRKKILTSRKYIEMCRNCDQKY